MSIGTLKKEQKNIYVDSLQNLCRNTLFSIVLYQKKISDIQVLKFLESYLDQKKIITNVFIYDNSSEIQTTPQYKNINLIYKHDASNPGVSKAYNFMADYASKNNFEWLFLCDDDLMLTPQALPAYAEAVKLNYNVISPTLICNNKIYSPCSYFLKRGSHLKESRIGEASSNNINFLNNGLMVRTSSFIHAGGYNERIPLYFSDFEFFERFAKFNSKFYWLDLTLQHNLSDEIDLDLERAIIRYKYFVIGAKNSSKTMFDQFLYFMIVLRRLAKLSFRYKSLKFINPLLIFFKND